MTIIVEVVTKTSIILSLSVILVAIFRRSSAAARYSIWLTGVCGALALPLVLYVVPRLSIPIPVAAEPTTVLLANPQVETIKSPEIDLPAPELPTSSALPETSLSRSSPPASLPVSWPTSIWLIGALLIATRSTWSICEIVKLRRGSRAATDSRLLELFSGLRCELSISANISLRMGSESIPAMTWGIVRHTILLPEEAIGWSEDRVRLVLMHELAHVTRKDAAMQFVIYGACSLYWFHPLVWYAAKRMRIERECACDDQVLNIGIDAEGYATHLVEIARSAVLSRSLAVSMTHPSHFEQRIRTLLDMRTNRRAFSRLGKSIMAGAAVMFVLVTASAHLTALPSSSLSLITAAPLVPAPSAGLAATTEQAAPTRNVPPKEDTTEISVGVSGQVTERIPSPWDYPRPDMFPGTIERSSKGVVMIPFAVYRDGFDTRVSVKHLPVGTDSGMVRVGLYSQADSLHAAAPNIIIKSVGSKPIGSGLKTDGTLAAGSTWTTTVSELLRAAAGPADFYGYIFIDTPFRDVEVDVHIIKPGGTELSTPAMVFPVRVPPESPSTRLATFEVASIKPSQPGALPSAMGIGPVGPGTGPMGCRGTDRGPQAIPLGRCIFRNVTAGFLISTISILDGKEYQLGQVPSWVTSQGFDIEGKADHPVTQIELGAMLKSLLIERFKCTFHTETRQVSGFTLVADPKGSKLEKATDQNPQDPKDQNTSIVIIDEETGKRGSFEVLSPRRTALLVSTKTSMATLAAYISRFGMGPVVDRTELGGFYAFRMRWQPDGSLASETIDRFGPTLTTALEEQLGLRLRSEKVPIEYLVIDHIEQPAQD